MLTSLKQIFQEARYLGMDYDPLHFSEIAKTLQRPSILAPVFAAVAFSLTIDRHDPQGLAENIVTAAIVSAGLRIFGAGERRAHRNFFDNAKAIDKTPDKKTVVANRLDAKMNKALLIGEIVQSIPLSMLGVVMGAAVHTQANPDFFLPAVATTLISDNLYRLYCNVKIAKGDWHIVNMREENDIIGPRPRKKDPREKKERFEPAYG